LSGERGGHSSLSEDSANDKFSVQPDAGTTSSAIHLVDNLQFFYTRLLFFDPSMSKRKARSELLAQR
jgi:hypothetical protein